MATNYSLTSDKKFLIVENNGVEIPQNPKVIQMQIDQIKKRLQDDTDKANGQLGGYQLLLDEYNKLLANA
jgi:hypothetical protein